MISENKRIKTKDITGKRYGKLIVLGFCEYKYSKSGHKNCYWNCLCDCGNEKVVSSDSLRSSNVRSCGCIKTQRNAEYFTTHNKTHIRLYSIYTDVKQRCFNPNSKAYFYYGGRGIVMCDEWKNNFCLFYDWAIENGYEESLTLERIDVNGNYEPSNCTWIPAREQSKNRRNSHYITHNGTTKTLSDWSRELKVSRQTLRKWENESNGENAIERAIQRRK